MRNDEKIIECMKEISENIASGMFMIDEETMDEMLECGARKYEIDELEIALDKAIEWMTMDYALRTKVNKGDKNE
tara:strand:+ start:623 stop:847 length:225 start_codon:yes stop_codon:yes gene_type:complete